MRKITGIGFCLIIVLALGCAGQEKEKVITIDQFLTRLESNGLKVGEPFEFGEEPALKKMEVIYGGRVVNVDVEDVDITIFQCDTVKRATRIEGMESRGAVMVVGGADKFARNSNLLFSVPQDKLNSAFYPVILKTFNQL